MWGLERGYCMMIGGDKSAVERMDPIFKALAPGKGTAEPTPAVKNSAAPPRTVISIAGPSGAAIS